MIPTIPGFYLATVKSGTLLRYRPGAFTGVAITQTYAGPDGLRVYLPGDEEPHELCHFEDWEGPIQKKPNWSTDLTTEFPTTPGLYWCIFRSGKTELVRIRKADTGRYLPRNMGTPHPLEDYHAFAFDWEEELIGFDPAFEGARWSGPLLPPTRP